MNCCGWASLTRSPLDECHTVAPFDSHHEHTRIKAANRFVRGVHIRLVLKTASVNFSSFGSMGPTSDMRAAGGRV